jgi:regulator of nucleoside diphosphate kinase
MTYVNERVFSNRDAGALARLLASHRRAHAFDDDASDVLADLMMDARFVADDALPDDCIGLGSRVAYAEERGDTVRMVTLVAPNEADPAAGRISVLSPVGLALIGRRHGALTEARLPNGRRLRLRVLEAAAPVPAAVDAVPEPERRVA